MPTNILIRSLEEHLELLGWAPEPKDFRMVIVPFRDGTPLTESHNSQGLSDNGQPTVPGLQLP